MMLMRFIIVFHSHILVLTLSMFSQIQCSLWRIIKGELLSITKNESAINMIKSLPHWEHTMQVSKQSQVEYICVLFSQETGSPFMQNLKNTLNGNHESTSPFQSFKHIHSMWCTSAYLRVKLLYELISAQLITEV